MRFFKSKLQIILSSTITILAVAAIAGATTIGTNISTDGVITVAGNVGIGTTSPTSKLTILSDTTGAHLAVYDAVTDATYNRGGTIYLGGRWSTGENVTDFAGIKGARQEDSSREGAGYLAFITNTGAGYNMSEQMRINNRGSVGIGTTSPNAKLEIWGGAKNYWGADTGNRFSISSVTSGDIMTVLNNGNVGIGTTSPAAQLSVNGRIELIFGSSNTIVGQNAGNSSITGNNNILFGSSAGNALTTGYHNTFLGPNAGLTATSSYYNTFVGAGAGKYNESGIRNAFFGRSSGAYNTTGGNNTFIGENAGVYNTTGSSNTIIGGHGGEYNQTGGSNTIMGHDAGLGTSGNSYEKNTLIGALAGFGLTTGSNNIIMGWSTGYALTSGSNNIIIGDDIEAPSNTSSNQLNIGNLLYGTGLDGSDTTLSSGNIGIGTTSPAAKFDVYGNIYATITSGSPSIRALNDNDNYGSFTWMSTGYLKLYTRESGVLYNDTFVLNAGNVGIGTTSPAVKLDINGAGRVYQSATSTCDAATEGSFFYNSQNRHFWGCDGTQWNLLDTN